MTAIDEEPDWRAAERAEALDHAAAAAEPGWLQSTHDERQRALHPVEGRAPEEQAGIDGWRYTDTGNADRLIAAHGDEVRYVPTWQRWLTWDTTRWLIDHDQVRVVELAKDTPRRLFKFVADAGTDERKRLISWASRSEMAGSLTNAVRLARTIPGVAVHHNRLDSDPWILNVRNGTIDLRTGQLRPHNPDDLVTLLAPCELDGSATAPTFDAFLERILPDPDVRSYVQRLAGYMLTGDVSEQVMAIWWGIGRNGKSTLLNILHALLGEYAVVAARELLITSKHEGHPTMFADLFRARLASVVEVRDGGRLDEAGIKRLTGGDPIKARRMREDFWTFQPTHKLVLAANHKPVIRGTDLAIWRRLHLVPFTVVVPPNQVDPHLAERIIEHELPGVLAWALDGCLAWQQHGLQPPDQVVAATEQYQAESDTVGRFLDEENITFGADCTIDSTDLVNAHEAWCAANGIPERTHWQQVTAHLKEAGATPARTKSRRYWRGVGTPPTTLLNQEGDAV